MHVTYSVIIVESGFELYRAIKTKTNSTEVPTCHYIMLTVNSNILSVILDKSRMYISLLVKIFEYVQSY